MGWWRERMVPGLADRSLRGPEIGELRAEACGGLSGVVLEVGFGGGLNLPHLPPAVQRVDAVEPSERGWRFSQPRRSASAVPVERVGLDGERLAVDDPSYDHVLCTFTLCTIRDPAQAVREMVRVLRPAGSIAFLEHGLAPTPRMARWQRRLDPVQRRVAGGCHLSRDAPALLREAGTDVVARSTYLPGPRTPWNFVVVGRAVPAS